MVNDLDVGDKVRFVEAHHAMNSKLKKFEGHVGVVVGTERPNDKVLVSFDKDKSRAVFERWEVRESRLEKVNE